jgi:hypothetical protein
MVSLPMPSFYRQRIIYSMNQEELDIFARYIELLAEIEEESKEDV